MFFFIILSIIMFFFCLYFYLNTKKLKQQVSKLELEIKEILERKIIPPKEDKISIETLSIETNTPKSSTKKLTNIKENQNSNNSNSEKTTLSNLTEEKSKYKAKPNNIYEEIPNTFNEKKKPNSKSNYPKQKHQAKPNLKTIQTINLLNNNFNPNEFIKTMNKPNMNQEDNSSATNNKNEYLTQLSKELSNDLSPKTIELTAYEKEQEEHAVISYQELLSLKTKKQTQEDENNFLEDLKEFRKSLD